MTRGRALAGAALAVALAAFALLDRGSAWTTPIFRWVAQLFYEQSALATLREPSQVVLLRLHLSILGTSVALALIAGPWMSRHGRRWIAIFAVGYAIRAAIWIAGSNLPLVPGDSCHYVEVATSILRGEGPVKHYVESYFTDYPAIRRNQGVLDDWATPLFAYLLAACYIVAGVAPGDSLEATFAVAKGLSFALNLATLPLLYLIAQRRFGAGIALGSMAVLAVLPVHALYAGFELRESLVALVSLAAIGALIEAWTASDSSRYGWSIASGILTGLAILSRNTAMAMAAACFAYGVISNRGKRLGPMLAWGVFVALTITPWAYATYREYGRPFYTYTSHFAHNFSWTVHHDSSGTTRASQFFTRANAPAIVRTKIKSAVIVVAYSTMILSLPLMVGFFRNLWRDGTDYTRLVALIAAAFVAGTLANIADVTQVAQLGRYYLPVFVLMVPPAVAGLADLAQKMSHRRLLACSMAALLWADPTWAYDYTWLSRTYQLHWPALREVGAWIRDHPESVPPNSRIITWFPWEFRLASRRTTILLNRSLYPPRIEQTIRQYGVTHILWGSFEPPPEVDPELWGPNLARVRAALGLVGSDELYRSPPGSPIGTYPVTLYRIGGGPR